MLLTASITTLSGGQATNFRQGAPCPSSGLYVAPHHSSAGHPIPRRHKAARAAGASAGGSGSGEGTAKSGGGGGGEDDSGKRGGRSTLLALLLLAGAVGAICLFSPLGSEHTADEDSEESLEDQGDTKVSAEADSQRLSQASQPGSESASDKQR